jgi:Family of unknown function (DUF6079)
MGSLFDGASLDNAIASLKNDLLDESGPKISTMRNYRFCILHYDPRDEFKLRDRLSKLTDELKGQGWNVLAISLHLLLLNRIKTEEKRVINSIIRTEHRLYAKDPNRALNHLKDKIALYIEGADGIAKDVIELINNFADNHPEETTRAVIEMLRIRAAGKTLFVVIDEVSQYVHQNDSRMLKLQSFVSDLGQKLKGKIWLLATGQQKLEDSADESSIGKLKDRFPPKLRVHLAPTNIRDVVHKRLLKKTPSREVELRSLFQKHRSELKLYGYKCDAITEEDFVEVYPMLPSYVDLLMQITSNLRTRSTRVKGDDHAIRGLLQLLGELFREQKLGEEEVGALVTANTFLDNVLSEETKEEIIQLQLDLSGREISTPEDVELLVNQIRDRLLAQLKANTRIRIIPDNLRN